jgi:hypothetical protein
VNIAGFILVRVQRVPMRRGLEKPFSLVLLLDLNLKSGWLLASSCALRMYKYQCEAATLIAVLEVHFGLSPVGRVFLGAW